MERKAIALAFVLLACGARPARDGAVAESTSPCESAVLPAPRTGPDHFDAFLAEYAAAAPDARSQVAARFVAAQQAAGGFPIVSSDGGVVFFHVGTGSEREVRVIGDFRAKSFVRIDWDPAGEPLARAVDGGQVWFARMRFRLDARLDYQIAIDGTGAPDPLNPRAIESGIAGPASELVMPAARVPRPRRDVAKGSITVVAEPWANPKVTIYLPPGYDARRRYPAVYTADGTAWLELIELPAILDDLIAAGRIEPVIAVMIDAEEDRTTWYQWNPRYLVYLDRVVAYVDTHYATRDDPGSRLHAGTSAGGRASLQVGLSRGRFANIALLSPGLAVFPHVFEPYFSGRKKPPALRAWLSAGTYEGTICEDTHTMSRWLRDAGVTTKVVYTHEGHSFGTWRGVAGQMLEYFFARPRLN